MGAGGTNLHEETHLDDAVPDAVEVDVDEVVGVLDGVPDVGELVLDLLKVRVVGLHQQLDLLPSRGRRVALLVEQESHQVLVHVEYLGDGASDLRDGHLKGGQALAEGQHPAQHGGARVGRRLPQQQLEHRLQEVEVALELVRHRVERRLQDDKLEPEWRTFSTFWVSATNSLV